MSDFYYPELDTKTIKHLPILQKLSQDHPSYWLTAPYAGDVQLILEGLLKEKKVVHEATPSAQSEDQDNWEFLYEESKTLYTNLKNAAVGNMETSEKMAYFRTATSLMEKLLGMQERANNLKQVSDFYQLILDIMEGELVGDQRTRVMQRLSEATKG
jgi:23S rRNA maturation mini-RNase III